MAPSEGSQQIPEDFTASMALLKSLIAGRKLLKSTLDSPEVLAAFRFVGAEISSGSDQNRLEAVAILGKAAEISKPVAGIVQPILRNELSTALPHTGDWGTADDRYYLAKGISVSENEWAGVYACQELATAEANEKASREIWATISFAHAESLAQVLSAILVGFSDDSAKEANKQDTLARKLNRVLEAIGEHLSVVDLEIGEDFGISFSRLVSQSVGRKGPNSKELRLETALVVLRTLVQILRLRFDASLDSAIYRSVEVVRGWWGVAEPPTAVTSLESRVIEISMRTIHMFARQGTRLTNLREALVKASSRELVDNIGENIVSDDPSLAEDISHWLSTGRNIAEAQSNHLVRQSSQNDLDELVGRLLLAVNNEDGGAFSLKILAEELSILEPAKSEVADAGAKRAKLIDQWARSIGKSCGLAVDGARGDLVTYDPKLHDTNDEINFAEAARILVPGLIKKMDGRPAKVVFKIQVEKA